MDELDLAQQHETQARDFAISAIRQASHTDLPSLLSCIECGEEIPEKRRQAIPGVQHCITCQRALEAIK